MMITKNKNRAKKDKDLRESITIKKMSKEKRKKNPSQIRRLLQPLRGGKNSSILYSERNAMA